MPSEDERAAAAIYTSLSSYVITASLGVIAAQAAVGTFVMDKRDHLGWFYVCMVVGLISSVASIVFGGRGIAKIASAGFTGNWSLKPNGDPFNLQALLCFFGMALLLLSVFTGRPKPENPSADQIQRLNTLLIQEQTQIDGLKSKCASMAQQLNSLSTLSAQKGRRR